MSGNAKSNDMSLTVLGARGSVPVSGPAFIRFGGATSCYAVRAGGELILLDAGTGIVQAPQHDARRVTILVSHLHLDHLNGLGMYGRLSRPGAATTLYLPAKTDEQATEAIEGLYSPPLWPLKLSEYCGELEVRALPNELRVGDVSVSCVEGNHPGGCKAIKVSHGDKSIVYATDYEYEPESFARLVELSRNASLLLFDAQYNDDQLQLHKGFGHSTDAIGLKLLQRSGAKRLLLTHHDPQSTDATLAMREQALRPFPHASFAREGETIAL